MDEDITTFNAEDYGFNFDINNVDATVVGNYGLGDSDFAYGLATLVDTGVTVASVFAGGAGLVKGGAQAGAKIGIKAAIKEFMKRASTEAGVSLAKGVGKAGVQQGLKNLIPVVTLGMSKGFSKRFITGSKSTVSRWQRRSALKNAANETNLYANSSIKIGGKEFNLSDKAARKLAFKEMDARKRDLAKAIMGDATIMGLLGVGTALSVQGKVSATMSAFDGIPAEVEMMADIMYADSMAQAGDIEGLLKIQNNLYNWENVQSNNLADLGLQGMGEDAADNMFWIQTRLAIAQENAGLLGADTYVPKNASEVILTIDELNNLYEEYNDGSGGIESQKGFLGITGVTFTDKVKQAQSKKYDFFFKDAAYYLEDAEGQTYRVTAAEYYDLFMDYAATTGEEIDWLSDVNDNEIDLLKTNFEKNSANWKVEEIAAAGPLEGDTLAARKNADILNKYGIYDLNDVELSTDGTRVIAAADFGGYKRGDTIEIANEQDFGIAAANISEYKTNPEARGIWDAAMNINSEEAEAWKAEAEAEVSNNKISAEQNVKAWYEDNGFTYDPTDQYNIDIVNKLANAGNDENILQQWKTEFAQKKVGVWQSKYKGWEEYLSTGQYSVKDLSEGYIKSIADIYGVNAYDIDVNDPLLKMIFKEDGKVMSVQEMETEIKKRPSYEYTQQAAQEYGDIAVSLANRWGV